MHQKKAVGKIILYLKKINWYSPERLVSIRAYRIIDKKITTPYCLANLNFKNCIQTVFSW